MSSRNKLTIIPLCLIAWILASLQIQAQQDFRATDALTLRLYYEKDWDSLIITGKQALKSGMDYYYLRTRIGTAYFEKQKYIRSVNHFRKAYLFNSGDPFGQEYLYLSLVYANRLPDARVVTKAMPDELKKKLDVKKNFLESVYFEGGPTFSSENLKEVSKALSGQGNIYTRQDRYGDSYYGHLGFIFRLAPSADLQLGYSYLDFSKSRDYQTATIEDRLDSTVGIPMGGFRNYYSFPRIVTTQSFPYNVVQHEIFLRSTIAFKRGYRILPFFHGIYCHYTDVKPGINVKIVNDTTVYNSMNGNLVTFPFARISYTFPEKDTSFYNFCAGLSAFRDFSVFTIGVNGSYSDLNDNDQFQAGLSLTWYPLATLDFYGTSAVTGFFEGNDQRLILQQMIGVKVFKKLWVEGIFIYGDLSGMNTSNGFVVFNNTDKIRYEAAANLIFPISRHVELSLNYQFFEKESVILYYNYIPEVQKFRLTQRTTVQPYNTNTIIGGIKWIL